VLAGVLYALSDRPSRFEYKPAAARMPRFDFLLVDFELSDLTGLELVEELDRLQARPTLTAMLSSLEDDRQRERARRLGIGQWLIKPRTTPTVLVIAVEQEVRLSQLALRSSPGGGPRE
jgi:DNA-binding response OmpR family regulator